LVCREHFGGVVGLGKPSHKNVRVKKVGFRLSGNQRRILEILGKYGELTAKDVAEILWARDIRYKTPEYSSVHRSLSSLFRRGLVVKVGGRLMWRRAGKAR